MAKREPGNFRGKVFGGFHRKDVLAYITTIYDELEQLRMDNEALVERCDELENLVQNLDVASARSPVSKPEQRILRPAPEGKPDVPAEPAAESVPVPDPTPEPVQQSAPIPASVPAAPTASPPEGQQGKPSLANPYSGRPKRVKVKRTVDN